MTQKDLSITIFFSGFTTLGVELAASRLLGNYFGTSNLVWASIIGLILIYLTGGYFLGGAWADRSPKYSTFYRILIWGSFLLGISAVISRPVLRLSANAFDALQLGILLGSFASVIILFAAPIVLLGTASPFAIRLAITDAKTSGKISGRLYAISTLGSFVGTFIPTLLITPLLGTYRTLLILSGLMLIVSMAYLVKSTGWKPVIPFLWMPVIILVLFLYGLPGTDKTTPGLIYETESDYNYIQVIKQDEYVLLRLNEGQGIHSVYHPQIDNYYGPWEQVLAAPFFTSPEVDPASIHSMAIVGLAAGTTARQASHAFPKVMIDGIEIDPKIVSIGQNYFGMDLPNLKVIIEDGRWALRKSPNRYQVISLDAYRPPYIPAHLTTVEFFNEIRAHLTEDGVMTINVGHSPNDRRLIEILATTASKVFPSIYIVDIPNTFNTMIYATSQPTKIEFLTENFLRLNANPDTNGLIKHALQTAVQNLQPTPTQAQVFTDDHAPVEWITNSIVINFLLSGDQLEYLK
ncbi:MAG TPA: fused MFS/spermidine synthase [Anaerolineaceae bacterium]